MQWTEDNGSAYGGNTYVTSGYGYGYSYTDGTYTGDVHPAPDGYGDSGAIAETATMPWHPADAAQWAGQDTAVLPGPADAFAPDHFAAQWDPAVADLGTEPPPDPEAPTEQESGPVFVDASGRRQRRVRRAARLLVIPAAGYVALLVSTALGGPTLNAPFLPSDAPSPAAPAPEAQPGATHPAGSPSPSATRSALAAHAATTAPAARPSAASATTAAAAPAPATTAAAPSPSPTIKGRGVGSTHKPVK